MSKRRPSDGPRRDGSGTGEIAIGKDNVTDTYSEESETRESNEKAGGAGKLGLQISGFLDDQSSHLSHPGYPGRFCCACCTTEYSVQGTVARSSIC